MCIRDSSGTVKPGYWRGIYESCYDTERPHTHPWEMLGFIKKPTWWETQYGTDYTSNNKKLWKDLEKDMTPIYDMPLKRSNEYASFIMDGIANNNEVTINANVMNDNLIDNLPENCCVEVPVIINSKGYKPQKFGKLPEQLAALMRTNINVQILTAEAALTKKREHIYHAAMLDPLTGANLTIDEIYSMTDKMIEAHGNYLPQYN